MIIPSYLKKGDKIRIVSPAGKVDEKLILPAVDWLKNQGYKVLLGEHVFSQHFQFAGTDAQRLKDLQTAFDDPDCSAIICSRGGYGTVRIIDQLNFSEFKKNPKWMVGYSDVTILHSAINNLGIASIHGTMPPYFFNENGKENDNLVSLINLLNNEFSGYQIEGNQKNKTGNSKGELVGGNLSILTSLLGTDYEIDTAGKILFIEEIDEYLYHIDRMICQLKLAGKFDNLAGLIVGDFTGVKDNDSPFGQTVEEIILASAKGFDFPICFGFTGGHDKKNLALTFGASCELNISKDITTLNF